MAPIAKVSSLLRMNQDITKQAHFNQLNAQYGDLAKTLDTVKGDAAGRQFSELAPHQREAVGALRNFSTPAGAPPSRGNLNLAFQNSAGGARTGYGKNPSIVNEKVGNALDNFLNAAPSGSRPIDDILSAPVDRNSTEFIRARSRGSASYRGSVPAGSQVSAPAATAEAVTEGAGGASAQSWMGKKWDQTVNAAKFSEGPAIPQFSFSKDRGVRGNASDNFNAVKDWYGTGTTGDKWKKAGYTAGAYMGVNALGRGLTGGGATYNADGERDIMGIPFF